MGCPSGLVDGQPPEQQLGDDQADWLKAGEEVSRQVLTIMVHIPKYCGPDAKILALWSVERQFRTQPWVEHDLKLQATRHGADCAAMCRANCGPNCGPLQRVMIQVRGGRARGRTQGSPALNPALKGTCGRLHALG
jgi:hypothetical protein